MKNKTVLVTGSAGLIGSESVKFFCELGFDVIGIDNNMRQYFFGSDGDTTWNSTQLRQAYKSYTHISVDIRNEKEIDEVFAKYPIDLVIHTAAQPSHDWAAREPMTDFTVNALGTLTLLEATRKHRPEAVFIFTSTNKVYGDRPNSLPLIETETRWELPQDHAFYQGIDESMSIDATTHSVFGASKVAADVMVQEYGRYFGMKTAIFRGGCLTGPMHSSAKLHGFLAYLVRCVMRGDTYTIFGYKGKQVRDNIHAHDVVTAFYEFYKNPRSGEVYNLGGGRSSNISMLEAFAKVEKISGKKAVYEYIDTPRIGDHIWYVSSMEKFRIHYPQWKQTYDVDRILEEIVNLGHFK